MALNAIYWDSSALIKRYFEEPGSDTVQNLFQKGQAHFTATLAHAEILSRFIDCDARVVSINKN